MTSLPQLASAERIAKRVGLIGFAFGAVLLVVAFVCFATGALLSSSKWNIPIDGWFDTASMVVGIAGLILSAITGIPLLLYEMFGKENQ